jgi:methanethiol S-methyltransferase
MIYVTDVLIIILLFAAFGFLHSYLASNKIKNYLVKKYGDKIAFYRLIYNITSLITFYIIYAAAPDHNIIIYDLPYPYDFIILVPQFLSLALIFWSLKYFKVREFLGISQIFRWSRKEYDINDIDENQSLSIRGPYKFVRHPLYLLVILFLVFRPVMDLTYLTFLVCITAYFYVGSFYEERKLVEKYGTDYEKYQKRVPRIFPFKIK